MESSYLDIKLKRLDRVYRPKEKVEGNVIVHAYKGWSHSGINLVVEGLIYLSHSNRGFAGIGGDANNRPIHLLRQEIQVCGAGKFPDGVAELPFSFVVNPVPGQQLYESYHGVYVSIVYNIQATCDRGVMKKSLMKDCEFLVEIPMQVDKKESEPVSFPRGTVKCQLESCFEYSQVFRVRKAASYEVPHKPATHRRGAHRTFRGSGEVPRASASARRDR